VHRARLLRDVAGGGVAGDRVAVKVVHPAARKRVAADLELLRCLAHWAERAWPRARWFSLEDAAREFAGTLAAQMDMRQEAAQLEEMRANFADVDSVDFPRPRDAFVSADVLVEDFVEGPSMRDFLREADAPRATRLRLAEVGVNAVCKMLFHDNLLHGDLHPGNMLVVDAEQPRVCFLDAGIVVRLGDREHRHFVRVLAALMRHDGERAGRLLIAGRDRGGERNGFDTEDEWVKAQDSFCGVLAAITDLSEREEFFKMHRTASDSIRGPSWLAPRRRASD